MKSTKDAAIPGVFVRREEKLDCQYFTVHSDLVDHRGGDHRLYNHIHMKNFGIAVVPIDNDGTTTLVGQYRYVLERYTWEVTRGGGGRDVSHIESAKRELEEETGYRADHWLELFAASASPGTTGS